MLAVALGARDSRGASPVLVAKILREIPRTEEQLAEAHRNSRAASLQISVGQPLEVHGFSRETYYDVTVRENGSAIKRKIRFEFSRLGIMTYGMEIDPADQLELPLVSKRRILRRVNGNYISIQLRVQRDPQSGAVYLYYKPFAAVGSYRAGGTQEFATLMEDSVRDLRGVGLFVKNGAPVTAESLRTFVAVNKNIMALKNSANGRVELKPHYELLFVRARIAGDQIALHAFGTDEYRTRLHYLKPYEVPAGVDDTTIKSTIFFTQYTAAKQSPTDKAARRVRIGSRSSFALSHLDDFAAAQGFEGGALGNVTEVLDAIIDGQIE
jgi:hypothetical protein